MCLPLLMHAQGIKFEEGLTWKQVLQKAKAQNKYIFVDCYATWCGPCKYMDKEIYPNDTAGAYYNDKFISVKFQMDTTKADDDLVKKMYADASKLMNKYKISAFPSFLFFSPDGNIVHREVGGKNLAELITIGEDALSPNKQYYRVLQKVRRGELSASQVKIFLWKVQEIEGDGFTHKIANEYINKLPVDSLFTPDNIAILFAFTKSSKDRGYAIIRDNIQKLLVVDKKLKEEDCKAVLFQAIYLEAIKPYTTIKNDKPDWKTIKTNLQKYGPLGEEALINYKPGIIFKTEIAPELKINSDWNHILALINKQNLGANAEFVVGSTVVYYLNAINFHHTEKNCKNFVAAATYYADSFSSFLSANALNSWAWTLFEYSNDKNELNKALEWSKRSSELQPDSPEILDTHANVLYKLGSVKDAISWQQKAVDVADAQAKKQNGIARPVFKESLEKMKRGERTWPNK